MFVYNDKTMKLLYDVARPLQSMIRMVTSIYHPNANINRLRENNNQFICLIILTKKKNEL